MYTANNDGNLSFWSAGNGIKFKIEPTGAATFSSSVQAGGRIFTTSDVAYGDLLSTTGAIVMSYDASGQAAYITSRNYTTSTNTPLNFTSSVYSFSGGNVGIGTTSPIDKLTVYAAGQYPTNIGDNVYLGVANDGGSAGNMHQIGFGYNSGSAGNYYPAIIGGISESSSGQTNEGLFFATRSSTSGTTRPTERMRITSGGNVGIGTTSPGYTLEVNGSVAGVGAYVNLSDARLKKDVVTIDNSLDKVLALRGVYYNWDLGNANGRNLDSVNHIGLIAQEVESVLPQVVKTANDENKTKSIAYSDIIPVLINAIKELNTKVETLEAELKKK